MISVDEDALICDLAETYQIYDYRQLPPMSVAVFSYGLKNDSRIKMKINNQQVSLDTLLLAGVSDKLNMLIWFQTADGQKGKNRPKPITDTLTNTVTEVDEDVNVYQSGEDFDKARQVLIGR